MDRLTDKNKTYMNNAMTKLQVIENLLEEYSIVDLNRLEMILREASETKMSLEDIKRRYR